MNRYNGQDYFMAELPSVSVVVPSFNRATTIVKALQSVLDQTFRDLEVVLVDDGSTDSTIEAARSLTDPRLRVISSGQNGGAGAARNRGIAEARAPWVAFQDSDDVWLPQKLEKQMQILQAAGSDYVGAYCGMQIFQSDGSQSYLPGPEIQQRQGDLSVALLRHSFISTQTLIARRDALLTVGGFDPALPALIDWDCVLKLSRLGHFALVDEPLAHQHFSINSITRSAEKRLEARLRILETHRDALESHPDILARHHYDIAGGFRLQGKLGPASDHLKQAIRQQPFNLRYRAMAVYLALQS